MGSRRETRFRERRPQRSNVSSDPDYEEQHGTRYASAEDFDHEDVAVQERSEQGFNEG